MINKDGMTPLEQKAAYSLASIFMLRMLGLFMILPVFSLYAEELEGSTPLLIGLAVGMYGLTQALLQIPFGMLSDRIGRKPVIIAGLIIFALGSVVAATADTAIGVVIGRAIQGAGAIAATIMALAADLTREEHRLKAMAIIGISIGVSFSVALIAGPILNSWIGVAGIFWLTAMLAIGGIAVVKYVVPDPVRSSFHRDAEPVPAQFKAILSNRQLLRLDFGIFALHMILTATFVVLPLALRDHAELQVGSHWMIYLAVMLISMSAMIPLIIRAEKKRQMKKVFVSSIVFIGIAQLCLAWGYTSVTGIFVSLLLFFIAFNVLEASLPSLIAKTAPPDKKGTAMGVYSSSQFLGAFIGGVTGGWLYGAAGISSVFMFSAFVALVWFFLAASMRNPGYLGTHMIKVGEISEEEASLLATQLTQIAGVAEVVVIAEDGVAYLKVDNSVLDKGELKKFSVAEPA